MAMSIALCTLLCVFAAAPQQPPASNGLGVPTDSNGFPIGRGSVAAPARPGPSTTRTDAERTAVKPDPVVGAHATPRQEPLPSGLSSGSPLLDVCQAVRSPASLRALGGVKVFWRLTTYGTQGEPLDMRDVVHFADLGQSTRDRLEHKDGRVYGRNGNVVFAQRGLSPWPTLVEPAGHELELFGMQLRAPWLFADGDAFAVTGRSTEARGAERLTCIELMRRPALPAQMGPVTEAPPTDRYRLLCDDTGLPRELWHTFASSGEQRRVLLDDWQQVGEIRLPFRRTYVDQAGRPTTVLQILRCQPEPVTESTFRI